MVRPTKMFTMKMDAALHKILKRHAAEQDKTMGELVIDGLVEIGIEAEEGQENEKNRNSK